MPRKTAPAPPIVPNLRKQCATRQRHDPPPVVFGCSHLNLDQPAGIDQAGDLHRRTRRLVGLRRGPEYLAIGAHHPGEIHSLLTLRSDQEDAHHHHVAKPEPLIDQRRLDLRSTDRVCASVSPKRATDPSGAAASTTSGTVPLT